MNNIALLIPHFNNPIGIVTSLQSINETEKIDVVIVDDGSIEKIDELACVQAFKGSGNIKFLYLEQNQGIEHALNHGLEYIVDNGYQYTARLDAGDICIGKRFAIQYDFLMKHPSIKLLGTNADAHDINGKFLFKYDFPLKHDEIKKKISVNAVFVHPSIMFNNNILDVVGYYPVHYKAAEDFAFTTNIVKHFETANLSDSLIHVEINEGGISLTRRKQQIMSRMKVIWDNFYLGYYPIYGLFRNLILYLVPDQLTFFVKKIKNQMLYRQNDERKLDEREN
ncbi:MAG: glycosyl transferase family 2 [Flavobacterium sp. BFFFF1]|uniref:glycosyltransferase n=1 Tax=unclassified Flavobacterium TaxID=196869 RepID=UPI000BC45535|nr:MULTISPECIES: glycosyltransferase [unclassified Flavobacterium]OYU81326.1 MAG: glycosyl transferase family 2 [Flavobacterium sp. BFFFF1]